MSLSLQRIISFGGPHRRKIRWAIILFLAYTVGGFLILPPIVRAVATRQLSRLLDRPVTIASLRLNPFVWSATVRGFLIRDQDGEPFVSWDEVYVNVQPTSVFSKAWTIRELRTSQPFVRVQVNRDRSLNFSDLIEKFSSATNKAHGTSGTTKPLALRVDLLAISGARASLTDLTPRTAFRRMLGPLDITLNHFQTDPNNQNPYAFSGTTDSGERFSWNGHFFLSPIRSRGEFALENLALSKYAPLYQDLVKFDLEGGTMDVRSTYRLEWSAVTNVAVITNTSLGLRGLQVKDRETGQAVAELPEFRVAGASADLWNRRAGVTSITVTGAQVQVKRARDAGINLLELSKPSETATNVSGGVLLLLQTVTNAFAVLLNSTNEWKATVDEVAVRGCGLRLEDQFNSRPVHLQVDEFDLTALHLSNLPGTTNLWAQLSLRWNTNGRISTTVSATIEPATVDIDLKLERLDLQPLDPYLEPFVDILILRSRLGMDATIQLRPGQGGGPPAITLKGQLGLEDLGAADARTGTGMVRWKALRFSGIEARLEPATFAAREMAVDDFAAHVIVESNGVINVLAAARLVDTNAVAGATNRPASAPGAPKGRSDGAGRAKRGAFALGTTNAAPAPLPVAVSVDAVVLTNGAVQFTDRTVSPPVDVTIGQLTGTIRGVSTRADARVDLDLSGKVEKTGPVRIHGHLYPLSPGRDTFIELGITDVDLHPSGPYVGKFLGYRLTKGRVGLTAKYALRDGQVKGTNLIKLDQFTLGEKVESPDALGLPIKLGVAILKDRQGVIELDVPVEGSLSDPEFRLGKVISRAIVNVLTKIVTSPFAALGAVFGGGGEELSQVEFVAGQDDLAASARGKLDRIVHGLYERPGLQLELEGAVDPPTDGPALRREKLEGALRLAKWQALGRAARGETTHEKMTFTPEEFSRYVERRYETEFGPEAVAARAATNAATGAVTATNRLALPSPRPSVGAPPRTVAGAEGVKGAVALRGDSGPKAPKAEPQTMVDQVASLMPLTATDYTQLAARRARAVRDYVLQSGRIEADRVLLTEPADAARAPKGARVYLKLQ
jgi:hypothetical protein